MDPSLRDRAIGLYDAFTHEHRDRRTLLRQMTALAGSVAAAEALIGGIAAAPAAAALTDVADPRLVTRKGSYRVAGGASMTGYFAAPRNPGRPVGAVMVIHENRGLQPHIEDVARRVALAGFFAVAPDFLSAQGGTTADENLAREMIAKADMDQVLASAVATVARLGKLANGTGRVGTVGFCWGGALVNRVALAAGPALAAAVSYYGPAPDPAEAPRLNTPLMLHYAGKDARVAQTGVPWVAALKAANKPVEAFDYPGVDHAFNNDTSAERYDKAAADLAWGRTIDFFHRHLDARA
ncbi:carboxymethylenebutenolidase [Sphingomonas sp. BE138]|uniref:dienelactone hydrolase family protein n=1 Tax=Sphingomonas sp. BE138 TaxID=2817845 RepID=UPI00285E8106|nr:dienelactone hydrolase family protein [Sphingomonas sp. BE138]MDR6788239.1 carboxymethylenebutenolidase [Sphingomonas sp. BE138]